MKPTVSVIGGPNEPTYYSAAMRVALCDSDDANTAGARAAAEACRGELEREVAARGDKIDTSSAFCWVASKREMLVAVWCRGVALAGGR